MNGGASIYNLDWSYTVGHEDGSKHDIQVTRTPSGPQYRSMVSILSRFMSTLNLDSLVPDNSWIRVRFHESLLCVLTWTIFYCFAFH